MQMRPALIDAAARVTHAPEHAGVGHLFTGRDIGGGEVGIKGVKGPLWQVMLHDDVAAVIALACGRRDIDHGAGQDGVDVIQGIALGVPLGGLDVHALMKAGEGDALPDPARIPDKSKLAAFPRGGLGPFEIAVHKLKVTRAVPDEQRAIVRGQPQVQGAGTGDDREEQGNKKAWHRPR